MVWDTISKSPLLDSFVPVYLALFVLTFKWYLQTLLNHPNPLVRVFLLVLLPAAPYVVIYGALFTGNN